MFKTKNFTDLVDFHLTGYDYPQNGKLMQSCLTKAFREARVICGRDEFNGDPVVLHKLGWWSGAMVYMSILDQIGSCYRPKYSRKKPNRKSLKSDFHLALFYFTDLSELEIIEIYSLRNAFFHDFSLLNKSDKYGKYNIFWLFDEVDGELLKLPTKKWNGGFKNINNNEQFTKLNLKLFGDLVESILIRLIKLKSTNKLKNILKGKAKELLYRYTFSND